MQWNRSEGSTTFNGNDVTDILILFFTSFSGFFKTVLMNTGSLYNQKNYSTEVNGETAQNALLHPFTEYPRYSGHPTASAGGGGQNTWAPSHDLEEEMHVVEDNIKNRSVSFQNCSPAPAPRILEIAGRERLFGGEWKPGCNQKSFLRKHNQ